MQHENDKGNIYKCSMQIYCKKCKIMNFNIPVTSKQNPKCNTLSEYVNHKIISADVDSEKCKLSTARPPKPRLPCLGFHLRCCPDGHEGRPCKIRNLPRVKLILKPHEFHSTLIQMPLEMCLFCGCRFLLFVLINSEYGVPEIWSPSHDIFQKITTLLVKSFLAFLFVLGRHV